MSRLVTVSGLHNFRRALLSDNKLKLNEKGSIGNLFVLKCSIWVENEIADMKWVSFRGWLGSALEIGLGAPSAIQKELGVEPLFLRIERSQRRRFEHLFRMPPGHLPFEVFLARSTCLEDPKLAGGILYPFWPGSASVSPSRSWERDVRVSLLNLFPLQPDFG